MLYYHRDVFLFSGSDISAQKDTFCSSEQGALNIGPQVNKYDLSNIPIIFSHC